MKTVSLPRLEFCEALLLAQLFKNMAWLNAEANRLKIFVVNRVTEILEIMKSLVYSWGHVPTEVNPADLISPEINQNQLKNKDIWWCVYDNDCG